MKEQGGGFSGELPGELTIHGVTKAVVIAVEYLGQASGGVAEGVGAMVFRAPGVEGAVYYEGSFAAGQPDGAVRVEQTGRKPRIRNFVAGVDKGVGDVGQWQAVKF